MKLNQTEPLLLADVLTDWLLHKEASAFAMMERFNHIKDSDDDVYTLKQKQYARHLLSAIRWLKSQIPKNFRDIMIANSWLLNHIESEYLKQKEESESCQSSNPLPTCSLQGQASLPNNSLEARQNLGHL